MKIITTKIPEVKIIQPRIFGDERGFFFESFQQERYCQMLEINETFVQDNISRSEKNVLRGLHYQLQQMQGKLVTVLTGCVFDVAVDIRVNSPTFAQWVGVELSSDNKRQLWVPKGFAHGFLVLSDYADFYYKCTDYYHPQSEKSILWNDQDIAITWPIDGMPLLSEKDSKACQLNALSSDDLPKY
ncbi:dTDP-4-dehydrorhamnose 3,5-epimerase [Thiotrichales bacterium 19X7-9]|nr:dTDP-4-dehydrorhamnose 3,5-epimerase [Thiotrichales bacterium 19X7-9]